MERYQDLEIIFLRTRLVSFRSEIYETHTYFTVDLSRLLDDVFCFPVSKFIVIFWVSKLGLLVGMERIVQPEPQRPWNHSPG